MVGIRTGLSKAEHSRSKLGHFMNGFQHSRERFETYAASAKRFGDVVAQAGADVHIGNHTNQDGSKTKMPALEKRKAGEPHPYVIGNDAVRRYIKVAEECARVAALKEK